jgi:hypothetical protein
MFKTYQVNVATRVRWALSRYYPHPRDIWPQREHERYYPSLLGQPEVCAQSEARRTKHGHDDL